MQLITGSVLVIVFMTISPVAFAQASRTRRDAPQPRAPLPETADNTAQGVALYERGDIDGAIRVLREAVTTAPKDSKAWHYFGLALIRKGNMKEAHDALFQARDLRNKSFREAYQNTGLEVWDGELLRLKSLLNDEIESRKKYAEILEKEEERSLEQAWMETQQTRAACMDQNTRSEAGHSILRKNDLELIKTRVLKKPNPEIPHSRFSFGKSGTVVLRMALLADGTVKFIKLVNAVGYDFTKEAVKAALKIKFEPSSICGKPINTFVDVEYKFFDI